MKGTVRSLAVVLAVLGCAAGWAAVPRKSIVPKQTDEQRLAQGNNAFALDLYAKLKAEEGNLFFSPFSISTALAMTYAGARGNTEWGMERVLRFPTDPVMWSFREPATGSIRNGVTHERWSQPRLHAAFKKLVDDLNARQKKGGYELTVANALWGQKGYPWLAEFLEVTRENYSAGLREVDFARMTEEARKTINAWVEKETKKKIKDLIPKGVLNEMTRLVLTNAIYFKGNWAAQFDNEATHDAEFDLGGPKTRIQLVRVPMMSRKGDYRYLDTRNLKMSEPRAYALMGAFQALELPYVKDELSMLVLLPAERDGLAALEKSLTVERLDALLSAMREREVQVYLPKFKLTYKVALSETLKAMGMADAFSLPPADFSGMDGRKDLFISAVLHKAFVDVNEKGTEAAAATGVVVGITSVRPRPVVFRADHPFLFLIRDNRSGSILFMGRLVKPEPEGESRGD